MPTWGQLNREVNQLVKQMGPAKREAPSPFDVLRRKYLQRLEAHTGRTVIHYATAWSEQKIGLPPEALSIVLGDIQGFMEAVHGHQHDELDLILHSPGGSAEATEQIVDYLRSTFRHVRVFIPVAAMSAATMLALSADEIWMGSYSQLGPIDPQFQITTPEGPRAAPGQAILDQFEQAKRECQDPKNIGAWLPILRSYAPGLIAQCVHSRRLAETLVAGWLERYMFKQRDDAHFKALAAAEWFANFGEFLSHARRVRAADALALELIIRDLEGDKPLEDAVLSVHHAMRLTLAGTNAAKIIENKDTSYVESVTMAMVAVPQGGLPGAPPATPPRAPGAMAPPGRQNRQQRRHPGR